MAGQQDRTSPAAAGAAPGTRAAAPRVGLALIAALAVAVELAVSARYGYHRDELYFLSAGQHLSFGYVDQPALTPLLARLSSLATGGTLTGLRVLPALALGVLVLLTGAISRRLGANRAGQLIAALATATCAEYLGALHLLTTTTPDMLAWAVTLYLSVRLLESRDPRWWLPIGITVGVGLAAKWNIAFLAAALLAGILLRGRAHRDGPPAAAQPVARGGRGHRRGAVRAGRDLAGPARLAEPGRVPPPAGRGRAQPGGVLDRPGGLHRHCGHPAVDRGPGLVAAQRGGPHVPAGRDRLRGGTGAPVRSRRQAVLPGRDLRVPVRRRGGSGRRPAGRTTAAGRPCRSAGWPRG